MSAVKVIPQYCFAHPYTAHDFRVISEARERNKCSFLVKEHGNLYFLLHNDRVHFRKLSEGKKDTGERVHKTVTL